MRGEDGQKNNAIGLIANEILLFSRGIAEFKAGTDEMVLFSSGQTINELVASEAAQFSHKTSWNTPYKFYNPLSMNHFTI